jgi:hypothetical protein
VLTTSQAKFLHTATVTATVTVTVTVTEYLFKLATKKMSILSKSTVNKEYPTELGIEGKKTPKKC